MAGRFSVEAVFKAIDRVTAPVTRMQNRVNKFTRSMDRGFKRVTRTVGKFTKAVRRGAAAVGKGAVAMGAGFALVNKSGVGFEQAITNVGAVTLQTRDQIADLEKMALKLGRTTKFTSTQAANAMETLKRSGFSNNAVLAATPAVLSAAAASGLEIEEMAGVVSDAIKGLGLDFKDAARVADVLTLASSKTKSTIGTLGESLSNVAATAKTLKLPLEDVVAAIALMQDVGLDPSVAGSSVNTMFMKMANPSREMARTMRRWKIDFKDAKGDMLDLPGVLDQLSKAAKRAGGNFNQIAFFADLVGLRGAKAAINLKDLFDTGRVGVLTKELMNALGVSKKMADLRMDTVLGQILLFASAVDGLAVKIFNLNRDKIKTMLEGITEWVTKHGPDLATTIGGAFEKMLDGLPKAYNWLVKVGDALVVIADAMVKIAEKTSAIKDSGVLSPKDTANSFMIDKFNDLGRYLGFDAGPRAQMVSPLTEANSFMEGYLSRISPQPQMVSPAERTAKSIEEKSTTNRTEVTVTAGSGTTAEVTKGKAGNGLTLDKTGKF